MISSVNHISFTVSNLKKSVEFYQQALGLKLLDMSQRSPAYSQKVTGIKGAHLYVAYLEVTNTKLELIQYLKAEGKKLDTSTNNVGSAHLCFDVENIDKFLKKFTTNGGIIVSKPLIIPGGANKGRKGVYGEDLDGNKLEFISVERFKTDTTAT